MKKNRSKFIRINNDILAPSIRLLDLNNNFIGIVDKAKGLELAKKDHLDLVEISPNATPPVCKILDYKKYIFQLNKKGAMLKKQQKNGKMKEVQLHLTTGDNDYQEKVRRILYFIENKNRVRVSVHLRGGEMRHKNLGFEKIEKLTRDLEEKVSLEAPVKMEGRKIFAIFAMRS